MHAHPRKITYLLCLRGTAVVAGLSERYEVRSGDLVKIDRGAFHQTTNISTTGEDLHLIEVELPRNKFDLVRLRDDYDRVGLGYEMQSEALDTDFRRVPFMPGGYMCRTSPEGHFEFSVTAAMDLHYRGVGEGEFHIPLGTVPMLAPELLIMRSALRDELRLTRDTYYLSAKTAG